MVMSGLGLSLWSCGWVKLSWVVLSYSLGGVQGSHL
jgi:hypothetical protein